MQRRRPARPLVLMMFLAGIVAAFVAARRRQAALPSTSGAVTDGPAWPPFDRPGPAVDDAPAAPFEPSTSTATVDTAAPVDTTVQGFADRAAAPADPAWVAPEADGTCPSTHPIKANDRSGIYHVPGGRFYERTTAERCYADPAAAEADGYRAAKGS